MKPYTLLRVSVTLGALSAILVLSPACKAQSEISPDHFDGTDSWAITTRKVAARKPQQRLVALQANYQQMDSQNAQQFATKRASPTVLDKRKATANKSKKQ